jgi:sec-independent protein translocase protein TatA
MRLGGWEILVVLGLVLLLFGPRRLPEVGRAFGRTIQEFRRSSKGIDDETEEDEPSPKDKGKNRA